MGEAVMMRKTSGGTLLKETGIGNLSYTFQCYRFDPESEIEITIHYYDTYSNSFISAFERSRNLKKITVNADFSPTRCDYMFANPGNENMDLEEIVINFDTSRAAIGGMFRSVSAYRITGRPIDGSQGASNGYGSLIRWCPRLEEIRFVPNTFSNNIEAQSSPKLSDDTVISIANAIRSDVSGKIVYLDSVVKTRLTTIVGIVNADGIFIKDSSGDHNVQDFITTTKGWTIA